ncbi:hypothetical protein AMTR_s00061p00197390 [Amborella trichopoda]|uniref:Uncharacterized protein n=1 Tax=Amborella trichopoda TaxID=13333 RepID=U5DAI3_AMBTC|nr:hypothetical protein AMTR_s00061p00197390 [Amborella trichopoda]
MKCKEKFSSNSKKPRNRPLSSSQFCDNKCLPHEPVGPDLKNRKDGLPYNCNCPSNSIKKEALERDNRVSDLTSGNEKDGNLCGSRKSFDYYSCDDENRNLVKHDFCREKLKGRNDCREHYARGAIFLENQESFMKVYSLLYNPDHMVMSSNGRPWVITEKDWRPGTTVRDFIFRSSDPEV